MTLEQSKCDFNIDNKELSVAVLSKDLKLRRD